MDEVYNKLELERQNNITQRIFANYLERKLFPHRKPQNRIPTIEEILPKTTSRPRRFSKPKKNKNSNENDDGKNIEVDNNEEDEVDTTDDEALQTVESEQHDLYDFNEDDPRLNEVFNGKLTLFVILCNTNDTIYKIQKYEIKFKTSLSLV